MRMGYPCLDHFMDSKDHKQKQRKDLQRKDLSHHSRRDSRNEHDVYESRGLNKYQQEVQEDNDNHEDQFDEENH